MPLVAILCSEHRFVLRRHLPLRQKILPRPATISMPSPGTRSEGKGAVGQEDDEGGGHGPNQGSGGPSRLMEGSPRERLRAFGQRYGTELPLAEGALLIAAEECPGLEMAHYLRTLDRLADSARSRMLAGDPATATRMLCEFLVKEAGFRGNTEDYGDPKNSFLNEVLDRRLGIPVTLAVVYLEVGWRLRLPLYAVGMPGHFLVGCQTSAAPLFVDAFAGTVLTGAGCERLFSRITGGSEPFRSEYLAPTPARYVLVRMLRNLKGIYLQQEDLDRAAAAVERILLLAPDFMTDARDLGLIRYRQGRLADARVLLEQYLGSVPKDTKDRATIEMCLREVRELLGRLN